jgi:hypothetical protein
MRVVIDISHWLLWHWDIFEVVAARVVSASGNKDLQSLPFFTLASISICLHQYNNYHFLSPPLFISHFSVPWSSLLPFPHFIYHENQSRGLLFHYDDFSTTYNASVMNSLARSKGRKVIWKVGWGETNNVRGRNIDRGKKSGVWGKKITFRCPKIRVINYWSAFYTQMYSTFSLFIFELKIF